MRFCDKYFSMKHSHCQKKRAKSQLLWWRLKRYESMVFLTLPRALISANLFDWLFCAASGSSTITLKNYDLSYMADSTGDHPKPFSPNPLNENTQLVFFWKWGISKQTGWSSSTLVTIVTAIVARLQLKFETGTPRVTKGLTKTQVSHFRKLRWIARFVDINLEYFLNTDFISMNHWAVFGNYMTLQEIIKTFKKQDLKCWYLWFGHNYLMLLQW